MTTLRELIDQHCPNMGNYGEIAALLNAQPEISNPNAPGPDVPHPPSLVEVLAIVPSAERLKIRKQLPGYVDDVRRAIDTATASIDDPEQYAVAQAYIATLIEDALTDGAISAETVAALTTLVQRTQDDPTWTATIPGPSIAAAAGLPTVTSAAVQAAMNNANPQ